ASWLLWLTRRPQWADSTGRRIATRGRGSKQPGQRVRRLAGDRPSLQFILSSFLWEELHVVGALCARGSQADEGLGKPIHGLGGLFREAKLVVANLVHSFMYALFDARRVRFAGPKAQEAVMIWRPATGW